jgi:hypothetical protein
MTLAHCRLAGAVLALVCTAHIADAQVAGRDVDTERRTRAGVFLEPGWHPYFAVGPAIPLGRLGDLATLGVSAEIGAWLIDPDLVWPGFGVELAYASFGADTDEPFTGSLPDGGRCRRG